MISQHWFRNLIMAWCCLITSHHYLILIQCWSDEYWANISCSKYPMTHSEAKSLFALSCWNVLFGLNQTWINILHWGQPHEATVVKMAPTRPLASRSFCPLVLLCDHRSLSNLQQRNTEAWYTLHQNYRPVSVLVFVQWSPKNSPRDDGRQICPK